MKQRATKRWIASASHAGLVQWNGRHPANSPAKIGAQSVSKGFVDCHGLGVRLLLSRPTSRIVSASGGAASYWPSALIHCRKTASSAAVKHKTSFSCSKRKKMLRNLALKSTSTKLCKENVFLGSLDALLQLNLMKVRPCAGKPLPSSTSRAGGRSQRHNCLEAGSRTTQRRTSVSLPRIPRCSSVSGPASIGSLAALRLHAWPTRVRRASSASLRSCSLGSAIKPKATLFASTLLPCILLL
mmetsp:Transcript_83351/g.236221  ORF Transcript_83351/g.236221 Transcript_83351/m.236221 type:complete len:242 (-) Transcript_83351:141-866(-)